MNRVTAGRSAIVTLFAGVVILCGCHKQTVNAPTPPPPPQRQQSVPATATRVSTPESRRAASPQPISAPSLTLAQLFQRDVKDAYFDYDKADIRSDARDALSRDADFLRSHPELKLVIAGHADERGGEEYNLALGERRAQATKQYLVTLGIPADRVVQVLSYGKERPFCTDANESCYQQNRRGHLDMAQ